MFCSRDRFVALHRSFRIKTLAFGFSMSQDCSSGYLNWMSLGLNRLQGSNNWVAVGKNWHSFRVALD